MIEKPARFSFEHTVCSHGWYDLAPFDFDEANCTLSYVFDINGGKPVTGKISDGGSNIVVSINGKGRHKQIAMAARHILRIDDEMDVFYKTISSEPGLAWVSKRNAGRLLRSPTVWEDLVKTLCTTNCSWSLTKKMVSNLVEKLGTPASDGRRAFPSANAMAGVSADFYRDEIRSGYRSPYFAELAEAVASGRLDPESWLHSDLPTAELKKEIKKVKGVGDYAAENLLKLLGRYDGLALDSWLRSQFYKKHNREKPCADKKIERHYKQFGSWRGLVIWCDMTERWFESEPPA